MISFRKNDREGWFDRIDGEQVTTFPDDHRYYAELQAWVDDGNTLAEAPSMQHDALIARRTLDISMWRDEQERAPLKFEFEGRTFDGGDQSLARINGAADGGLAATDGFFWTDDGNNDVPFDQERLDALRVAMNQARALQGFRIHVRQREMKEQISDMSADQLAAFSPGWPEDQATSL